MSNYGNKDQWVKYTREVVEQVRVHLHPEDAVEALRAVATHATEQANEQAETNDREGTPERPKPAPTEVTAP